MNTTASIPASTSQPAAVPGAFLGFTAPVAISLLLAVGRCCIGIMAPDPTDQVFKVWSSDDLIFGPVDLATLVHWLQERRVLRDTRIHSQAANDWVAR